ncbi:hypothetical protein ES705_11117 [subsurface metagenome]
MARDPQDRFPPENFWVELDRRLALIQVLVRVARLLNLLLSIDYLHLPKGLLKT